MMDLKGTRVYLSAVIVAAVVLCAATIPQIDYVLQVKNKPAADLRNYGGVCDGSSNSYAASQSADTAGATTLYLPPNCVITANSLSYTNIQHIIGGSITTSLIKSTSPASIGVQVPAGMIIENVAWETVGCVDQSGTPLGTTPCYVHYYKNNRDVADTISTNQYGDYVISSGKTGGLDIYNSLICRNYGVGDCLYAESGVATTNGGTALRARESSTAGLGVGIIAERYGNAPGIQLQDFTATAGGNAFGWPMMYVQSSFKTAGDMFQIIHNTSTWPTGAVFNIQMSNAGGTFTGNIFNVGVGGSNKFLLDYQGNATNAGFVRGSVIESGASFWRTGAGSPNGAVPGSPGDLYTNTSGGSGTTLYVKESGTGTMTGWVGK